MRKKWLYLIGLGIAANLAGCSTEPDSGAAMTECQDEYGQTYFCAADNICCGNTCIKETDANCGTCGNRCSEGSHCSDGMCICPATGTYCALTCIATGCVDTLTNPNHCGGENIACQGGEVCDNGVCSTSCSYELENCDGRCIDLENNVDNCGACGNACAKPDATNNVSRSYCLNGTCHIICTTGYLDADDDARSCEQKTDFSCGNGIVELGEACDGQRLNDQTCATIVGPGSTGNLTCLPDCGGFDTSGCSAPTTCGNGMIDGSELCDGSNLGGATCATILGEGSSGYLGCNKNCSEFDTSYCSAPTTCGNGKIDSGETCDGALLPNGSSCETVVGAGSTGNLSCAANCYAFDRSSCTAASTCGNGILEAGEECDGNNFNGKTCDTLIGAGSRGSLVCNNCKINSDNCSAASTCGNNIIDGNDVCDGNALNGATCASIVGDGASGTITCRDNCAGYDISGCTAASKCGNGIIEPGEVCDGPRLNDRTCASEVGFGSKGTLICSPDCLSFDVSGCTASTTCGNGIIETGEICDGTALNGATCESQVGSGSTGTVLCGADCTYLNLSGCSAATQCGNGSLDAGEVCDGKNINNATCESIVGTGSTGTIRCGDGCKHFDTSSCTKSTYCGDGQINQNELCDGKELAGRECKDVVGYGSKGTLQCSPNCMEFDTSRCTAANLCGNGKLDAGEVCDGAMLNGATCSALVGFGSTGKLTCNDTCTAVITTACSEPKKCGNGILDSGEVCDGAILNGKTCAEVVGFGSTGTPQCNDSCTGYVKGTCTPELKCGNGMLDTGEKCDTTNLNGKTCADIVGIGSTGTLTCDASCNFNTTLCTASRGCGNGTLEDNEECDGTTFAAGSNLCKSYAPSLYKSGKITCDQNCHVVTTACTAYCGDGTVNGTVSGIPINEACDGEKFPTSQNTCEKVVGTGSTGTLACSGDCKTIITNQCTAAAYCGDGKINTQEEQCDGSVFSQGTDDCSAYSSQYMAGNKVKCLGTCKIDTSACQTKPYCGDGTVNTNDEWCDRDAFRDNKVNCTDWDSATYSSGKVKCNNTTCKLDMSACIEKPTVKCGNGKLDDKEFCDGSLFAEGMKTCQEWSKEYSGGTIKCTSDCQIDASACELANKCGNGVIDDGETCDGSKLPFSYTSCKTYNTALYEKGTIKCSADCKSLDLSACVSWCGNGKVNTSSNGIQIGEVCDGTNLNKKTCEKVVGSGSTGTLACAADCKSFDTTNCSEPVVATCGDGVVNQVSEYCDGTAFKNGKSACSYWNSAYTSGEMKCTSSCTLDESACIAQADPVCGDGILNQTDEECDLLAFDPSWNTCEKVDPKYGGGTLKCTKTCEIDDSSCILKSKIDCGNGKLDDNEECDGTEFLVDSCYEYSTAFGSGTLSCTDDCVIDTSKCAAHKCGDGVLGPDEECDGKAFDSAWDTCVKVSNQYSGGTLNCTTSCEVDSSACTLKCGNGKLDGDEWCDGSLFIGNANKCSDWGFASGSLGCTKTCEIDTTACRSTPEARCGDGILNTNAESCDGSDFLHGIKTCADYSPSLYVSGALKCTQTCTIDESACVKKPVPQCGDGNLDDGEDCDGKVFHGNVTTCSAYSNAYINGNLSCTKACKIDTSACETAPVNLCGNGKLDSGEKCDGAKFENNKSNCSDWGDFAAGTAACSASCEIVLTNCILQSETAKCGDNKINTADEECDGTAGNIYGVTKCSAYNNSYTSGDLKCTNTCKIDTSACVKATSHCGNGKLDDDEWCEGTKFMDGIKTCSDYSPYYNGGTLKCNSSCEFDISACTRTPVCAKDETRCSGQSLQMCDDVHNAWYEMALCGSGKDVNKPVCWAENGDGNCEAATDPVVDLQWCNFQWLNNDANHNGYGRILVPSGEDPSQILAYMACTNDLSKPVSKWTQIGADMNNSCGDCGSNKEFMTTDPYKGVGGTNYCTFIFDSSSRTIPTSMPAVRSRKAPPRRSASFPTRPSSPKTSRARSASAHAARMRSVVTAPCFRCASTVPGKPCRNAPVPRRTAMPIKRHASVSSPIWSR